MRIRVVPYKQGSRTAREIANRLGGKRVRVNGVSRFRVRSDDFILNYGNSTWDWRNHINSVGNPKLINHPTQVAGASNKRIAFQMMREGGVRVPRSTIVKEEAQGWNSPLIVRSKLQGSGGRDAVYVERGAPIPDGRLYVEYIKKASEFRVHVIAGEVVDVQQKRKRNNEDADFKIRNHDRGWVFSRYNVDEPSSQIREQAVKAINSLGLDFGAVDVIWNDYYQQAYVLEVNTAPGLEATTLGNYVAKFQEMIDE